jgi:hypothetical protein
MTSLRPLLFLATLVLFGCVEEEWEMTVSGRCAPAFVGDTLLLKAEERTVVYKDVPAYFASDHPTCSSGRPIRMTSPSS